MKVETLKVLPAPPERDVGPTRRRRQRRRQQPGRDAPTFDASTDGDRPQMQTSSAFNRGGDPFPGLSPDGTASSSASPSRARTAT